MKKLARVILCFCLCFSLLFTSQLVAKENRTTEPSLSMVVDYHDYSADDYITEHLSELNSIIVRNLDRCEISTNNVYIGNQFNIYGSELFYYPVFADGEIVLLIQLITTPYYSITVGSFFADTMNQLEGAKPYKVACYEAGICAENETDMIILETFLNAPSTVSSVESNKAFSIAADDQIVNIADRFAAIDNISQSDASSNVAGVWYCMYNFPRVAQVYNNTCWAAAMSCIIQGRGVSNDTMQQVVMKTLNQVASHSTPGQYTYMVNDWFSIYYGIHNGTMRSAPLTFAQTMDELLYSRAYIQVMQLYDSTGQSSGLHDVVVIGFDDTSTTKYITYMDPGRAGYYDAQISSSGEFIYTNSGFTYRSGGGVLYRLY